MAPAPSWGEDEGDDDSLELYSGFEPPTATVSRIPRPLSQTAENTTVITAREIEQLNAHTLADILDTVPGIQIQHSGGPGIDAYIAIQGGQQFFTQVFLDGVAINNQGSNFADVSSIPANIIERVEVVKGSASAAWGSALAGVVNVVTKSPEKSRSVAGSVSASIGERTTADTRAELSGTVNKLGYYLSGGYLGSDGLIPTQQIGSRQVYAKLTYDLPDNGLLWATFSQSDASMGDLYAQIFDFKQRTARTNQFASLGLRYSLAQGLELELTGKQAYLPQTNRYYLISDGTDLGRDKFRDQSTGVSAKLLWRTANNLLAIGSDYNHQEAKYYGNFSLKADRWGVFLNDTLTLGSVSVSPGVRLDHTETNGDQVSSSLGLTWQVTDTTLLRAYTGRGFNIPFLPGPDPGPSRKIWTTQVGAESTAIPYLWAKGTLFRNMTWGGGNRQELAMGSELELRTVPVFHTSLGASWTYTETTFTGDGTPVRPDRPTQTVKLALRYDDGTYRAMLFGNHIYWNSPTDYNAKNGLLWDLHLGATVFKRENNSLELFFSGHNLFNGDSYNWEIFPSVGRWFEGGMRVRF